MTPLHSCSSRVRVPPHAYPLEPQEGDPHGDDRQPDLSDPARFVRRRRAGAKQRSFGSPGALNRAVLPEPRDRVPLPGGLPAEERRADGCHACRGAARQDRGADPLRDDPAAQGRSRPRRSRCPVRHRLYEFVPRGLPPGARGPGRLRRGREGAHRRLRRTARFGRPGRGPEAGTRRRRGRGRGRVGRLQAAHRHQGGAARAAGLPRHVRPDPRSGHARPRHEDLGESRAPAAADRRLHHLRAGLQARLPFLRRVSDQRPHRQEPRRRRRRRRSPQPGPEIHQGDD